MLNYKIISIDLDGTYLDSNMDISLENRLATKKYADMGGFCVPNSGRAYGEMPQELKEVDGIRYFICSNGADIYDKQTGERIFLGLDRQKTATVVDIITHYQTFIMAHWKGNAYVDEKLFDQNSMDFYNVNEYFKKHISKNAVSKSNFKEFLLGLDSSEMYTVFFHDNQDLERCANKLKQAGLCVASTAESNIEIFLPTTGKGNALIRLAQELGVDIKQTIAVGDSDNDIPMLQVAGLSLATANANQTVKQITHKTICSNDQHVMQDIINNIIKNY